MKHLYKFSYRRRVTILTSLVALVPVIILFSFSLRQNALRNADATRMARLQELTSLTGYVDRILERYEVIAGNDTSDADILIGLCEDPEADRRAIAKYCASVVRQLTLPESMNVSYRIYFAQEQLFRFNLFRPLADMRQRFPNVSEESVRAGCWIISPGSDELSYLQAFALGTQYGLNVLCTDLPLNEIALLTAESVPDACIQYVTQDCEVLLSGTMPVSALNVSATLKNGHRLVLYYAPSDWKTLLDDYATPTLISLFCVLFVIICMYCTIRWQTRSIGGFIRLLEKNDPTQAYEIHVDGEDEIGLIKRSFLQILNKNQNLYRDLIEAQQKNRNLEISLLLNRLNPHLLYNSLSVMRWHALRSGNEELKSLVDNMTRYYRAVLNQGNDILTLREELALTDDFVRLYSRSQDTQYQLVIESDDAFMEMPVFKLLLQPFVENAIRHGLTGCAGEKCVRIRIVPAPDGNCMRITIEDNGHGMDAQTVASLNNGTYEKKNAPGGYGLKNAAARLTGLFGAASAPHYESELGAYTRVTFLFPMIRADELRMRMEG